MGKQEKKKTKVIGNKELSLFTYPRGAEIIIDIECRPGITTY